LPHGLVMIRRLSQVRLSCATPCLARRLWCGAFIAVHFMGASHVRGQVAGNLTFDQGSTIDPGRPGSWAAGGHGYPLSLDTFRAYEGRASLRSASPGGISLAGDRGASSTGRSFGVATQSLPVEALRGKTIQYSGWIRTNGVTQGYAGLW